MDALKNILIANAFWDEEVPGGSYRIASEFARHLARKGHQVHYLCGTGEATAVPGEVRAGVHLWRYRMPARSGFSGSKLIRHLLASYQLARRIRKQNPIHVLNGHSQLQFFGADLALGGKVSRRFSSHSPLPDEMEVNESTQSIRGRLRLGLLIQIERWVLRHSEAVQSYSEFEASLLLRRYGILAKSRLKVVPGWVNYSRFSSANGSREDARRNLGGPWSGASPTFFSVRRLVPRMGLENLIEAAAALKGKGLKFRVFIGGNGPGRDSLQKLIFSHALEDCVTLLGRIPEQDLPLGYRAADCVVLPSQTLECFGLTLLEAYAAGTPVIATPIGAIPEVIEPGLKAWLTDDVSAISIANRMEEFLRGRLCFSEGVLRAHARLFDLETRAEELRKWLLEDVTTKDRR